MVFTLFKINTIFFDIHKMYISLKCIRKENKTDTKILQIKLNAKPLSCTLFNYTSFSN